MLLLLYCVGVWCVLVCYVVFVCVVVVLGCVVELLCVGVFRVSYRVVVLQFVL